MKCRYIIFASICFMFGCSLVFADSSNFEATINMEPEITENQINLVLGFRGEEVMAVSETITYDSTRINLLDVVAIDNFAVTLGEETIDGKWRTIKVLADSMYSFTDTNYAVAVFEVKDNFKNGKSNDLFLYNVEAVGPEKSKYRYRGDYLTLTRESASEMYFKTEMINNNTKLNYFLKQYLVIIVVIFLVIIGIIVFIILHLPSRRKEENRQEQIGNSIKSENFNGGSGEKVMINPNAISEIGEAKKVINLQDAIVVSDLKPFENNPTKVESEPVIPIPNDANQNVQIDPFNMKLEDAASASVQEIPETIVNPIQDEVQKENGHPRVEIIDTSLNSINNQIPTSTEPPLENNDLKAPILTVEIGSDDIETIEDDNDSNNHPTNINGIMVLLILSIVSLFSANVYALEDEKEYKVEDLRECLVGNIPCESYLDYNSDGNVDIIDLMATRNTIDVNFEKLLNTDPGFKELHKFSPNIKNEEVKKTSQAIVVRSTTKRTAIKTTRGTTLKTTRGTTTKRTRTTTSRTTRTTTLKTTTLRTTTQKATYQVNVVANNGKVISDSAKTVTSGLTASFAFSPNTGYMFSSVSCTNGASGSYTKTSNTLKVANIKSNSTCTVNFKPRNDIKISITGTNGTYSPSYKIVSYGGSASFIIKPSNGYEVDNATCTNSSYSLSGNTLNVSNVTNDSTCTVKYKAKYYSVVVKDTITNRVLDTTSVPYNYVYKGSFQLNRDRVSMYANGSKVTLSKTQISDNLWSYSFSRKVTTDLEIEFR